MFYVIGFVFVWCLVVCVFSCVCVSSIVIYISMYYVIDCVVVWCLFVCLCVFLCVCFLSLLLLQNIHVDMQTGVFLFFVYLSMYVLCD